MVVSRQHLKKQRYLMRKKGVEVRGGVRTDMQLRFCQFQMRMVWSSDALTIQGCWVTCDV